MLEHPNREGSISRSIGQGVFDFFIIINARLMTGHEPSRTILTLTVRRAFSPQNDPKKPSELPFL